MNKCDLKTTTKNKSKCYSVADPNGGNFDTGTIDCQLGSRTFINSKNNNSLKSFLKVFKVLATNKSLNLNKIIKVSPKKKFKKVFTILKSPHIYKSAQEQFESILFAKTFKIH